MPSTEWMGRSTTESGRSPAPTGISTTGNCQTSRSNPLSSDSRRTMASAWRSRSRRSCVSVATAGSHLGDRNARVHQPDHAVDIRHAIHQLRGDIVVGHILQRQHGMIAARIAFHADRSNGQQPAGIAARHRSCSFRAQAANRQAGSRETDGDAETRRGCPARRRSREPRPYKTTPAAR